MRRVAHCCGLEIVDVPASKCKTCRIEWNKRYRKTRQDWKRRDPVGVLLHGAKIRAKKRGLEFDILADDLQPLPTHCPVLGLPLLYTSTRQDSRHQYASLDRIDSSKGYVRGNVRIISNRANTLKNDATVAEMALLYADSKRLAA